MKPKHRDYGSGGVVMKLIRWLSPVDEAAQQRLTEEHWEDVNAEFSTHQKIAEALCLGGMFAGLVPPIVFKPLQPWDIGIMFGSMIAAPLCYIFLVCFIKGFENAYSRWSDFSTMKYAIPWRTQLWYLYIPVAIIGVLSIFGRLWLPIILE